MRNKEIFKKVIGNDERLYIISSGHNKTWFYDSWSHRIFCMRKNDINTVITNLNQIQNILPIIQRSNSQNVMINTSYNCNLNCRYCYRRKGSKEVNSAKRIKDSIQLYYINLRSFL